MSPSSARTVVVSRSASDRRRGQLAQARLAAIVDASDDAIIGETVDGMITDWNKAAERLFGYSATEASGKPISILIAPESAHAMADILARVRRGEQVRHFETTGMRKDGSRLTVSLSLSPIEDSQGRVVGIVRIARDVSEKQRTETDTHDSMECLQAILDQGADGILMLDDCDMVQMRDPAVVRACGYSRADVVGNDVAILTPETVGRENEGYLKNYLHTGIARIVGRGEEVRGRRKDGSEIPLELGVAEVRLGPARLFTGIIRDITERKWAEEALRRSEARFRNFLEQTGDGFIVSTHDGTILDVNQRACQNLGYARKELLGLHISRIDPELIEAKCRQITMDLSAGRQIILDSHHRRRDGSLIPVEVRMSPYEQDGQAVFLTVVRDLTERRRLEEQYRQAQKFEVFGQRAGGVVHDFNNLLNIINGYGDIVLTRLPMDHPVREMLEEMTRAGKRGAALTRQLLAFSHKPVLAPEELNLNVVVVEMEKMLSQAIGENISLAVKLQPDLGCVWADAGQLEQVLLNLVINARDAMPSGGKLTIETHDAELDQATLRRHPEARPGWFTHLTVDDTGCGMCEEVRSHIFEPFFTTKAQGKGTGLGLATVNGIVKQCGGIIEVASEPGVGTSFKVFLPTVKKEPAPVTAEQCLAEALCGFETVLLAEDEGAVRTLARIALTNSGFAVLEASDGLEALRMVEDHRRPIHLLVSDMAMPELCGLELAERLLPLYPEMKVLFLSGDTEDVLARHGILPERVNFLEKPFSMAGLVRKVRDVLDAVA